MAVAVGFEPTEACTSHAFEICDPVSQAGVLVPFSLVEERYWAGLDAP